MDGIESIVEHILNQAREKVALIETASAEAIAAINQQAERVIADATRAIDQKSNAQAAAVINRATSQAALETRRSALETRQSVIDEVLTAALDQLCNLPDADKSQLYKQLIVAAGASEGTLTVNDRDRNLMQTLLPDLPGHFELSSVSGHFAGGLLIGHGRIEDNLTFDLLVRNSRPQLAALAASILYPDA